MAIACLQLVTFLPELLRSVPTFFSCMTFSTFRFCCAVAMARSSDCIRRNNACDCEMFPKATNHLSRCCARARWRASPASRPVSSPDDRPGGAKRAAVPEFRGAELFLRRYREEKSLGNGDLEGCRIEWLGDDEGGFHPLAGQEALRERRHEDDRHFDRFQNLLHGHDPGAAV